MKAGDFVLVEGFGNLSRVIEFGERIRDGKEASRYSHAAWVMDDNGRVLEALGKGICWGNIGAYKHFKVVDSGMSKDDRLQACHFAISQYGIRYGYVSIASIIMNILTPPIIDFESTKSSICSEFVARCLEHGGFIIPGHKAASQVMPSDLATWYKC